MTPALVFFLDAATIAVIAVVAVAVRALISYFGEGGVL